MTKTSKWRDRRYVNTLTSSHQSSMSSQGTSDRRPDGPPQEIAGTLSNDFTLANTRAESKGEDREEIQVSDSHTEYMIDWLSTLAHMYDFLTVPRY